MAITAPLMASGQEIGKLVACEGDSQTISTQLRLLPPSQKILVLPSPLEELPKAAEGIFDVRSFIRDVHATYTERTEAAQTFLRSSTKSQPRLVFMNGGSVTARTICISKISKEVTKGDISQAEAIFNDIVKDGVKGLMKDREKSVEDTLANTVEDGNDSDSHLVESMEDAAIKAMKSAEFIDREAAVSQTHSRDSSGSGTVVFRSRPTSIWINSDIKSYVFATPEVVQKRLEDVVSSPPGDDIVTTVITVPNPPRRHREKRDTFSPPQQRPVTAPPNFSSIHSYQTEDESEDDGELEVQGSPGLNSLVSGPATPLVVYGEACIVNMQTSPPAALGRSVRTVKSLDLFHPSNSEAQEFNLTCRQLKHAKSAFQLQPKLVTTGDVDDNSRILVESSQLPRTFFRKASQTTIRRSPNSSPRTGSSFSATSSTSISTSVIHAFIDKGTDAGQTLAQATEAVADEPEAEADPEPFEAVFPMIEDLVIHFTSEPSNDIFDSILRSYQKGSYPIYPGAQHAEVLPSPAVSTGSADEAVHRPASELTVETDDEGSHRRYEFDPYSSDVSQTPSNKQWLDQHKRSRHDSAVHDLEPPTPLATPPPSMKGNSEKFCQFSPINNDSVIEVQNSLRELLSLRFPTGESGYSQHYFPVVPEADRIWKPVWSCNETDVHEARTVDQIIALGCEDDVRKDFFDQISGQIQRLGTKRNGMNRSGKLDLGYLFANAMQTLSTLPLNTRGNINISSDPTLLATFLVPHLEAYLAANTNTRLLILTFPAIHLSTILALRALLGNKLFKIAGVLDSSDFPPALALRPRTPSCSHTLSNEATKSPPKPPLSYLNRSRANSLYSITTRPTSSLSPPSLKPEKVSFSKANYLLPSTASDAEIAAFLSNIWAMLMETSAYYTPEPDPKPVIVERLVERFIERPVLLPTPTASPTSPAPSSQPPVSYRTPRELRQSSSRETKISRLMGADAGGYAMKKKYAGSISSTLTMQSTKTSASVWECRDADGLPNYFVGEEDSEEDSYERMVMGRAGARPIKHSQKAGKKKALIWLGLA